MQNEKRKRRGLFLIALTGPVGAGKSYIAGILAKKLKAVHVRTDDIRVALRAEGKSYGAARRIAADLCGGALSKGRSVISDFDAVLPRRQKELARTAKKYGARFFLIRIQTPEKLILARLRKKRYTKKDLFVDANEATRVYFIRKKLHERVSPFVSDFVIDNGKPLSAQIKKVVRSIKEILSIGNLGTQTRSRTSGFPIKSGMTEWCDHGATI